MGMDGSSGGSVSNFSQGINLYIDDRQARDVIKKLENSLKRLKNDANIEIFTKGDSALMRELERTVGNIKLQPLDRADENLLNNYVRLYNGFMSGVEAGRIDPSVTIGGYNTSELTDIYRFSTDKFESARMTDIMYAKDALNELIEGFGLLNAIDPGLVEHMLLGGDTEGLLRIIDGLKTRTKDLEETIAQLREELERLGNGEEIQRLKEKVLSLDSLLDKTRYRADWLQDKEADAFSAFLSSNGFDGDEYGSYHNYFEKIRNDGMTALELMALFRTEQEHLFSDAQSIGAVEFSGFANQLESVIEAVSEFSYAIGEIKSGIEEVKSALASGVPVDPNSIIAQNGLLPSPTGTDGTNDRVSAIKETLKGIADAAAGSEGSVKELYDSVTTFTNALSNLGEVDTEKLRSISSAFRSMSNVGDLKIGVSTVTNFITALNAINDATVDDKIKVLSDIDLEVFNKIKLNNSISKYAESYKDFFDIVMGVDAQQIYQVALGLAKFSEFKFSGSSAKNLINVSGAIDSIKKLYEELSALSGRLEELEGKNSVAISTSANNDIINEDLISSAYDAIAKAAGDNKSAEMIRDEIIAQIESSANSADNAAEAQKRLDESTSSPDPKNKKNKNIPLRKLRKSAISKIDKTIGESRTNLERYEKEGIVSEGDIAEYGYLIEVLENVRKRMESVSEKEVPRTNVVAEDAIANLKQYDDELKSVTRDMSELESLLGAVNKFMADKRPFLDAMDDARNDVRYLVSDIEEQMESGRSSNAVVSEFKSRLLSIESDVYDAGEKKINKVADNRTRRVDELQRAVDVLKASGVNGIEDQILRIETYIKEAREQINSFRTYAVDDFDAAKGSMDGFIGKLEQMVAEIKTVSNDTAKFYRILSQMDKYKDSNQFVFNDEDRSNKFSDLRSRISGAINSGVYTKEAEASFEKEWASLKDEYQRYSSGGVFGKAMSKDISDAQSQLKSLINEYDKLSNNQFTNPESLSSLASQIENIKSALEAMRAAGAKEQFDEIKAGFDSDAKAARDFASAMKEANKDTFTDMTGVYKQLEEIAGIFQKYEGIMNEGQASKLNEYAERLSSIASAGKGSKAAFEDIKSGVAGLNAELKRDSISSFANQIKTAFSSKFTASFAAGTFISNMTSRLFSTVAMYIRQGAREMINSVKEVDSALTQLSIVTGKDMSEMGRFFSEASKQATALGQSVTSVLGSIETFTRLGYNLSDALDLSSVSTMMGNVAAVDVDKATTGITSIIKAYGFDPSEASHVGDVLTKVGQDYAISAEELMEAYERGGAALAATGVSFEKSAALFAAANASIQNAPTVGTALKTVSARMRKSEAELSELGEDTSDLAEGFSKYRGEIMALSGVDIMLDADSGEFKDLYTIFQEVSKIWDKLSDTQQSRLAEIFGGTRQLSVISSIIGSVSDMTGAYEDAMNSTNALSDANDKYVDSIEGKWGKVKAQAEVFSTSFLDADAVKFGVDALSRLLEVLTALSDNMGDATAAAAAFTVVFKGIVPTVREFLAIGGGGISSLGDFVKNVGVTLSKNTGISVETLGISGVAAAVLALTNAYNDYEEAISYKHKYDVFSEQAEAAEKSRSAVESLESQIKSTNEQIDSLKSQGELTIFEQDELNNLKEANRELGTQLSIKKAIAEADAATASSSAYEALTATGRFDESTARAINNISAANAASTDGVYLPPNGFELHESDYFGEAKFTPTESLDILINKYNEYQDRIDGLRKKSEELAQQAKSSNDDLANSAVEQLRAVEEEIESAEADSAQLFGAAGKFAEQLTELNEAFNPVSKDGENLKRDLQRQLDSFERMSFDNAGLSLQERLSEMFSDSGRLSGIEDEMRGLADAGDLGLASLVMLESEVPGLIDYFNIMGVSLSDVISFLEKTEDAADDTASAFRSLSSEKNHLKQTSQTVEDMLGKDGKEGDADYRTASSAFAKIGEYIDHDEYGSLSNVWALAELYGGKKFKASDLNEDNYVKRIEQLEKWYKKRKSWFDTGDEGNDATGLFNFIEYAKGSEKVQKVLKETGAVIDKMPDGNYVMKGIDSDNIEKIAKSFGLTSDGLVSLMERYGEFGLLIEDTDIDSLTSKDDDPFADIGNSADDAKSKVEALADIMLAVMNGDLTEYASEKRKEELSGGSTERRESNKGGRVSHEKDEPPKNKGNIEEPKKENANNGSNNGGLLSIIVDIFGNTDQLNKDIQNSTDDPVSVTVEADENEVKEAIQGGKGPVKVETEPELPTNPKEYLEPVQSSTLDTKVNVDSSQVSDTVNSINNQKAEMDVGVDTSSADSSLSEITSEVTGIPDKKISVIAQTFGEEGVDELGSSIDGVDSEEVTVTASTNGKPKVDMLSASIKKVVNKNATVTVKTSGQTLVDSIIRKIAKIADKSATITTTYIEKHKKIYTSGAERRTSNQGGSSSGAEGTVKHGGASFAKGSWGTKRSGRALVGELGPEIFVRNGRWFTVGDNGAEFVDYRKNDIIFNASQTEELLGKGKLSGVSSRGKVAYATGTAFSTSGVYLKKTTGNTKGSSSKSNSNTSTKSSTGKKSSTAAKSSGKSRGKSSKKSNKKSSKKSSKKDYDYFDWIEIKINRIEDAIARIGVAADSSYRTTASRLKKIGKESGLVSDELKAQEKARARYMKQANSVTGLTAKQKKAVRNGTINITKYSTNSATYKAIEQYKEWYDKAMQCKQATEDLNEQLSELSKQRFDTLKTNFENAINVIESKISKIDKKLSQAQASGSRKTKSYYEKMISLEEKSINKLKNERQSLQKALDKAVGAKTIQKNSEAWYEMTAAIDECSQSIEDATTKIIEYKNEIRSLRWGLTDDYRSGVEAVADDTSFLIGLLENEDLYDKDTGAITKYGETAKALRAQKYDLYMLEAASYKKQIDEIREDLAKDPTNVDILERQKELIEGHRDAINAANEEKDALKDLAKDGVDALLDSLKDIIDEYERALDSAKSLYDYQNSIVDKVENISDIEKQLNAYVGDTSEETRATVQRLKNQLKDANKDLKNSQYDEYINQTKDLLSDMYDDYEELLNDRLDDIDSLLQDSIDYANYNAELIASTVKEVADSNNYSLNDSEAYNIWKNAQGNKVLADIDMLSSWYGEKGTELCDLVKEIRLFVGDIYGEKRKESTNSNVSVGSSAGAQATKHSTYASGARRIMSDEFAWTQEDGPEAILRPTNSSMLMPLKMGDSVLDASATDSLWRLANDPQEFINDNLGGSVRVSKIPISSSGSSTNNIDLTISLPNVHNYKEFMNSAKADPKFEKLVQAMTIDRVAGRSSMSKNAINW